MNKFPVIILAGLTAILTHSSFAASGTFSGRIWNDIDRDGLREAGEPWMSNMKIYLFDELAYYYIYACPLTTFTTDPNGNYNFTYTNTSGHCFYSDVTNKDFFIVFGDLISSTPLNVGTNDEIDNDFEWPVLYVTNDNVVSTNMDVGLYLLNSSVSLECSADNAPAGTPLYVTNDARVTLSYRVVNEGQTLLSQLSVFDDVLQDITGSVNCPALMLLGESVTFSTQVVITASVTNTAQVSAVPVNPISCVQLYHHDPANDIAEIIILVVTNNPLDFDDGDGLPSWWEIQYGMDPLNAESPNANSDSDWMSNYEEYIADTNPTNGASYFPRISLLDPPPNSMSLVVSTSLPSRVYNVWRSTNLLDDPQSWLPLSQDQTGTSAAITFTITNDLPGAHYRTGVRLP